MPIKTKHGGTFVEVPLTHAEIKAIAVRPLLPEQIVHRYAVLDEIAVRILASLKSKKQNRRN